jgi:hypothetical protein
MPRSWARTHVYGRRWETVLGQFGKRKREARLRYERFVAEGLPRGRRPELVGGGLVRSLGGWSEVISVRRTGERSAADARILGSGDFVEQMLAQAEAQVKTTLGWRDRFPSLATLATRIAQGEGVELARIRSRERTRQTVRARRILCQMAVKRFGYSGATVARFPGVTTSLVNRMASAADVPGANRYLR